MSPLQSWLFVLLVCGAVLCYAYAVVKVAGAMGDWLTGRAAERERVDDRAIHQAFSPHAISFAKPAAKGWQRDQATVTPIAKGKAS